MKKLITYILLLITSAILLYSCQESDNNIETLFCEQKTGTTF